MKNIHEQFLSNILSVWRFSPWHCVQHVFIALKLYNVDSSTWRQLSAYRKKRKTRQGKDRGPRMNTFPVSVVLPCRLLCRNARPRALRVRLLLI